MAVSLRIEAAGRRAVHAAALCCALASVHATIAAAVGHAQQPATVTPRAGLVITRSTRLTPGTYALPASRSLDSAIITVRGDDVTLDMRGVTLIGTSRSRDPDQAQGVAIRIDGGRNVRIVGAVARGYHIALMARGTQRLVLDSNDFSHNWKPRLFSLVEHESLADWLSYHKNDKDEWLRFGAGIYLADVRAGTITGNRVEEGMNGLMLVRSDSLEIRDNNFSYNSGLGIGMYRASANTIVNNRLDYNVRGYSHGFYRRGQDSAGILMFEQCLRNVVAFNSVTHGGDGLFIWAGQTTMDTGVGGVNDNMFFANDFSFAPTNGMEATFSRNQFIGNRIEGSDHGLWGGYSYSSRIVGNCFIRNRIGVAIEHGQDNQILHNRFDGAKGDSIGVSLWANPIEPSDWGYPKHRDTKSRDYQIADNAFVGVNQPFSIRSTTSVDTGRNAGVTADRRCDAQARARASGVVLPAIANAPSTWPRHAAADLDRSAIIVDEWGPYDWRSPKLWPLDSVRSVPLRLQVLGPAGRWQLTSTRGVLAVSPRAGKVGDTITVTPHRDSIGSMSVQLMYVGAETTSPRGVKTPARAPVMFGFARFEPVQQWTARIVAWTDSTDPRTQPAAFDALLRSASASSRTVPRMDWMWSRSPLVGIPATRMAVDATTRVVLPTGTHTLRTLSDDAIRVWVDGVLVIDHWTPHETMTDYATIRGGAHDVRVQYVQVDGWTELRVDFLRGLASRSTGSVVPF
jgi:parallel beta-helix repeat protein